jgi:hypothetical protein
MHRAILMILLAVGFGSANAGWIAAGKSANATLYVDPDSSRGTGNIVKMWNMWDYKSLQGTSSGKHYASTKTQSEYDCNERKYRFLTLVLYSGNMGGGETVHVTKTNFDSWRPVPSGSGVVILWQAACGKN